MFEEGRPCTDLPQQLHAVESAVTNAKREVIHDHIERCLDGSEGDTKTAMRTFERLPRPRTSRSPKSRFVRNFDRDVRQRSEAGESALVIIRLAGLRRDNGDNRAEVTRPQAPQVQIGELVALAFDGLA